MHQTGLISVLQGMTACVTSLLFCDIGEVRLGFRCAGLGEAKALMGDTEEAQPMLQRAHSLLLRWLGASHPHTARAQKALQLIS